MFHTIWFGKEYHLTLNRKGVLISHKGGAPHCHRVHYNAKGQKI